ncbi:MAG: TIM barrel protein [Akkermansiaceae bacterium]|jgi:hydroxypyruvate isomerase
MQHSVCRWCFQSTPLSQLAEWCQDLGISGIDLLHPHEVAEVSKFGISCPITAAPEHPSGLGCIENAFNKAANHAALLEIYTELIPQAAAAGIPNVITFSGNREGLSDEEGIKNCAAGLAPLLELAEKHDITLIMELLNSKVDHPDYQCDHTAWGVALCQKLDSPRFKLLYDIYHMQVMEGDVMATIKSAAPYIGHYHTAGYPGRHEINETQELYYPAIVQAIKDTGYTGFLAQEFIPTWDDQKAALADAIERCQI